MGGLDVQLSATLKCYNSSFASPQLVPLGFKFQGIEPGVSFHGVRIFDLSPLISSTFNNYSSMHPVELTGPLKQFCGADWAVPVYVLSACAFLLSSCMLVCSIRHGTAPGPGDGDSGGESFSECTDVSG